MTTLPADTGIAIEAYPGSDTKAKIYIYEEGLDGTSAAIAWTRYPKISFTVYPVPALDGTAASPLGTINSVDDAPLFEIQNSAVHGVETILSINVSRMVLPVLPAPKNLAQAARNYYETVLKGHAALTDGGEVLADGKLDTSRPTYLLYVYAGSET